MNPVLLGKQVQQGLTDLIRASFHTSSPTFESSVDSFISNPGNLLQGPWTSIQLPFRQSGEATDFFPELQFNLQPYRHQQQAFERLVNTAPRSTLVATGTGSGKTECYLWPIFDWCRQQQGTPGTPGTPGIKAIIIYPMNALAADQARRIAKTIDDHSALTGVRCGLYADKEPQSPNTVMTAGEVITQREALRRDPPDILLTNYKMLDYLLLRGTDRALWKQNAPESLRYLVVDELHTFDGAQGADLALLIRRLKSRLGTPKNHLVCIGSSATLGSGPEAPAALRTYATKLFGEAFDEEAVVQEDRLQPHEFLQRLEYTALPTPEELVSAVAAASEATQPEAAKALATLFFDDLNADSPSFEAGLPQNPAHHAWRVALGTRLLQHVIIHRLVEAITEHQGPPSLDGLVESFRGSRLLGRQWDDAARRALVEALVVLVAWARTGTAEEPKPVLNVRIQMWARELARLVATLPRHDDAGKLLPPELHHSDDLDDDGLRKVLPLVQCRQCGVTAHLGRRDESSGGIWAKLPQLYDDFFNGRSSRIRFVFHEPVAKKGPGNQDLLLGLLNSNTLALTIAPHRDQPGTVPVWVHDPTDGNGRVSRECPACGVTQGIQILGLRSARLTASLATTLFNSDHNEEDPIAKPRLLLFSDSVQDAAQRAAVAEIRNASATTRKALYRGIAATENKVASLQEVFQQLPADLRVAAGDESFVARFIARDQVWRDTYRELCRTNSMNNARPFIDQVALRLGWEFFADLTYRSQAYQTLESSGLAVADVDPEAVRSTALRLAPGIVADLGEEFALDDDHVTAFLTGILQRMRLRGAVAHPYVLAALENATDRGPNWFAAQHRMGAARQGVLPLQNPRTSTVPTAPALRRQQAGYEPVLHPRPGNWYQHWADAFFLSGYALAPSRYDDLFRKVFERCVADGLILRTAATKDARIAGYLLVPERVQTSTRVVTFRCNNCRRTELLLAATTVDGMPCTRIGCTGNLERAEGAGDASAYLQALFRTDRYHRVVAREHTGILEADDRRELEDAFIKREMPWDPNLISATPTLEMGIDIGDLSTLLLCSVPPEEANYVQRIGRTGRRDGNSLNLTLAAARPHDLQYWEDPSPMLAGEVRAPGVFLEAGAVLRRQATAWTLDRLVATSPNEVEYGNVRSALLALEHGNIEAMPLNWFAFLDAHDQALADGFIALLPEDIQQREPLVKMLREHIAGTGPDSLRYAVRAALDEARSERDGLKALQDDIDAQRKQLKRLQPAPTDLEDRLNGLKQDRLEITRSIRDTINKAQLLQFLTDRGLLPNYAFPEAGVKLKSIITRKGDTDATGSDSNMVIREYIRPASNALSELAPAQTFYAEGREVRIDRIDIETNALERWRFCQQCTWCAPEATVTGVAAGCPACGHDMWADSGSVAEVNEMRTVLAATTEQKAAIRDQDERQQITFERVMFPAHTDEDIERAWAIDPEVSAAPFGYEFIPSCEFRDLNFGSRSAFPPPDTAPIAGQHRSADPFRICRQCGRLQDHWIDRNGEGQHLARCKTTQQGTEREDWEAAIYLMRRFTTEALRIVVPVSGSANQDELKSFIAGVELGLKRHFEGKVDHIRSAMVEERLDGTATLRSLYLYDSVPGGSGYLRQLAEDTRTMERVLRHAALALRDCRCAADGRNGCFRCVRFYRALFGPGEPQRDLAFQMIEAALSNWEHLREVKSAQGALGRSVVESELEARFIETLRSTFGDDALKPMVLPTGARGFQLTVKTPEAKLHWAIEPQVQIDTRFPGLPRKRVDFLLTCRDQPAALPIVVEMDGWAYHATTLVEDIELRMQLIRSGAVQVWTLNWEDLDLKSTATGSNPLHADVLGPSFAGTTAKMWTEPAFADFRKHKTTADQLLAGRSLDALLALLRDPTSNQCTGAAIAMRLAAGRGTDVSLHPGWDHLDGNAQHHLQDAALNNAFQQGSLTLFLGVPGGNPTDAFAAEDDYRLVLHLAETIKDARSDMALRGPVQGMWRLVNLLQGFAGLHIAAPGLELDPPSKTAITHSIHGDDPAWQEPMAWLDDAGCTALEALRAAETPVPDMFGQDLMSGDQVIGQVEIGWAAQQVGLVVDPFELPGWTLVPLPSDSADLADAISRVIRGLTGTTT